MRMVTLRQSRTVGEKEKESEEAKVRMATQRKLKNEEDYDYDKIIKKQRIGRTRTSYSGRDHLIENLKAKKGMRLLKSYGPLKCFSNRNTIPKFRKGDDLFEWKKFISKSQQHSLELGETARYCQQNK